MGDNWGSHRSAPVKLEFLKTSIFSPSKVDTSPKTIEISKIFKNILDFYFILA